MTDDLTETNVAPDDDTPEVENDVVPETDPEAEPESGIDPDA